jgi:hypothetical protein
MPDRQAVDFLRRRYAAAILRDDPDTACRLRSQLDRIMNQGPRPCDPARRPEMRSLEARATETRARSPQGPAAPVARPFQLKVLEAAPVTGLLERPRFLPHAPRSEATPDLG